MNESEGFILNVNSQGELSTPTIKRENGQIVMEGPIWNNVKRLTILEKVNAVYFDFLGKHRMKEKHRVKSS